MTNDIRQLKAQLANAWVNWLEQRVGQTLTVNFEGKRTVTGPLTQAKSGYFELCGFCVIPARLDYYHDKSNTLVSF